MTLSSANAWRSTLKCTRSRFSLDTLKTDIICSQKRLQTSRPGRPNEKKVSLEVTESSTNKQLSLSHSHGIHLEMADVGLDAGAVLATLELPLL